VSVNMNHRTARVRRHDRGSSVITIDYPRLTKMQADPESMSDTRPRADAAALSEAESVALVVTALRAVADNREQPEHGAIMILCDVAADRLTHELAREEAYASGLIVERDAALAERDTLRRALEALAVEWVSKSMAGQAGGYAGCAARLRAVLAKPAAPEPKEQP
jgi:hypothetical protein